MLDLLWRVSSESENLWGTDQNVAGEIANICTSWLSPAGIELPLYKKLPGSEVPGPLQLSPQPHHLDTSATVFAGTLSIASRRTLGKADIPQ